MTTEQAPVFDDSPDETLADFIADAREMMENNQLATGTSENVPITTIVPKGDML